MRERTRLPTPASLGAKLVMVMTGVGLAGALGITLLLASIITPSFDTLEIKAIAGHVERTRAALAEFEAKVESAVRDYGDWTASYDYMANPAAAFERSRVSSLAMSSIGVDGLAYVAPRAPGRRVVIARWPDPATGAERPAMRAALMATIAGIDLGHVLARRRSGAFYARVGDSVAAIGVAKVRRSDGSGTARGYVLMARVIGAKQIADRLQPGAYIDLQAAGDTDLITPDPRNVSIAVPMIGADGHAVATTRFTVPRDASILGRRMLMLAVAGSTLLLLIVLVVLRRMIAQLVLRPLHRVESHMQRVSVSGSLGLLEEEKRSDEIGSLGRSFNTMLRQLKDLREQLEVQSFDLGRSESAVAVMHNVRNALNPISTILSQGIAQRAPVDRATLDRAVAELAQPDMPLVRREKLVAFVAAAVRAQDDNRQATRRELNVGREAMAHVLEIIGQQQKAAHERPTLEVCDVTEIIARNATIARYAQGSSIAFSFPGGAHRVMASRVILSQVIGNLFGNAAESIFARGGGSGLISASVREEGGQVTIEIRDDGEGFSREVGATLFQRGFSTRAHKSGGLGLHWCANSMNAMEGSLRLESEGKAMGAVAILTLRGADAMKDAA
jgi:signal transduction histidine kinase